MVIEGSFARESARIYTNKNQIAKINLYYEKKQNIRVHSRATFLNSQSTFPLTRHISPDNFGRDNL